MKTYDIRFKVRAEKLALIIDNFIEYVEREIKDALPRSPLGKALDYAKKHLPGLKNVLLDGSLEVDNNAAERAIIARGSLRSPQAPPRSSEFPGTSILLNKRLFNYV